MSELNTMLYILTEHPFTSYTLLRAVLFTTISEQYRSRLCKFNSFENNKKPRAKFTPFAVNVRCGSA